jgi:hypothetical protein
LPKAGFFSIPSALALMLPKPTLMSLAVRDQAPAQHIEAALRGLGVVAHDGQESVGATFQLGGKLGVGRFGGIEKTSLISLTSEERRARPHMRGNIAWRSGAYGRCQWSISL